MPVFALTTDATEPRVIGFLKADMLPAGQIDAATTSRLSVIATHVAPALQRGVIAPVANVGGRVEAEAVPLLRKWRLAKVSF